MKIKRVFRYFVALGLDLAKSAVNSIHLFYIAVGTTHLAGDAKISSGARVSSLRGLKIGSQLKLGRGTRLSLEHQGSHLAQMNIGRGVKLGDWNQLVVHPGQHLEIGDFSSTHGNCYLAGDVSIGRYCLFSANIFVSSGDHRFQNSPHLLIKDQDKALLKSASINELSLKTVIEDDCWIGWGTVIKRGVTIGKGSIIGANSVVTKSIPPYSVAVGSPARVVKSRFVFDPPTQISAALKETHPFLYRGFELQQESWIQKDGKDFLVLNREGWIVLGSQKFASLEINLFSDGLGSVELSLNGHPLKNRPLQKGHNRLILSVNAEILDQHKKNPDVLANFHLLKMTTMSPILFQDLSVQGTETL